jgi:hypothetical protein
MSQENKSPELYEAVWQAWLKKNKADEKLGLVKRLRVAGFLMQILTVGVLLWRSTG